MCLKMSISIIALIQRLHKYKIFSEDYATPAIRLWCSRIAIGASYRLSLPPTLFEALLIFAMALLFRPWLPMTLTSLFCKLITASLITFWLPLEKEYPSIHSFLIWKISSVSRFSLLESVSYLGWSEKKVTNLSPLQSCKPCVCEVDLLKLG